MTKVNGYICLIFSSVFFLALLLSSKLQARPVSYQGGTTMIQYNNYLANSLWVHYSPTATDSIGARFDYLRPDNLKVYTAQYTRLVQRWNTIDSQANFYLMGGFGATRVQNQEKFVGSLGLSSDWETRRWYLSYKNRFLYIKDSNKIFYQAARIGIAPYEGGYDDIQLWVMLQMEHAEHNISSNLQLRQAKAERLILTPLIRLFKGPYLAEFGVSSQETILFNWIVRF